MHSCTEYSLQHIMHSCMGYSLQPEHNQSDHAIERAHTLITTEPLIKTTLNIDTKARYYDSPII